MGFWNKKGDKSLTSGHQAIEPWPEAKKITKNDWESGTLPIGWYVFDEGYGFQAIRPRADGQSFDTAWFQMYSIEQLVDWLGVKLPHEMLSKTDATAHEPESISFPDSIIPSAVEIPPLPAALEVNPVMSTEFISESDAPNDCEKRWAFGLVNDSITESEPARPKNRKRPIMERFRVTEKEDAIISKRVGNTGLTKNEFFRQAVLTSQIVVKPINPELIRAIDALTSELGRQGGLIAMYLKPNKGQRVLNPEEWDYLVEAVHYIDDIKPKLKQLMEDISNN